MTSGVTPDTFSAAVTPTDSPASYALITNNHKLKFGKRRDRQTDIRLMLYPFLYEATSVISSPEQRHEKNRSAADRRAIDRCMLFTTAVCKCVAYASSRKTTRGLHHVGGEHEHAQTQTRFFAASPSLKKNSPASDVLRASPRAYF